MKQQLFSMVQYINTKIISFFLLICLAAMLFSSCKGKKQTGEFRNEDISNVIAKMTDIMVHDITNPPLAARFFSYACLSGYEIVSQNNKAYKSMHGLLNDYPEIKKPDSITNYSYQLASLIAIMETAKKMQPSGKLLDAYETKFLDSCANAGIDAEVIENSKQYAGIISKQILSYAKADGYNKISNQFRYTPTKGEGNWYPTPPAFMAAVEPYFQTVRSFTLDSATQFKPVPPIKYDPNKNSPFYSATNAVYKEDTSAPQEHRIIAAFWDCNPFAVQDQGHLQYGFKKISPGAHWLGITGIATMDAKKDFNESMKLNTIVSIGLMDAFICCWDEKFRSNRIRPETAIRRLIDPSWEPLLQTPPFPEYLSGHSCISSTTATILTHYLGDKFSYTDSVEIGYGLPPRKFSSFQQAASEAAISRFYGGIHYMDAIDNGMAQGAQLGEWIVKKLK
ncbi:MAG: vanadium-dependent haloperoxidase [Ferruginibacter sp.]